MNTDLELAYLGLELADPAAFGEFLANVVGLVPGEPTTDGATTWRNDDSAHRLLLFNGPSNDACVVGFAATSPESFASAGERARRAGLVVTEGSADERSARRVDQLLRYTSPWGVPIEIVLGLASAAEPFDSPLVPGGFLTSGMGFGHIVFVVDDLAAAGEFATEVVGLSQSDFLEADMGGLPLSVRFYHCNPRHHTLALGSLPIQVPQKLHHVMVETVSQDNVGNAFDRAWKAGLPIANALGKHDNDKMFSFYVVTPAGFQLEFGYGARTIGEDWTENRLYDRISEWGHQPISSPFHQS
jgi:2,3-dihydroxybiphenyl 1,2-dioxygenase